MTDEKYEGKPDPEGNHRKVGEWLNTHAPGWVRDQISRDRREAEIRVRELEAEKNEALAYVATEKKLSAKYFGELTEEKTRRINLEAENERLRAEVRELEARIDTLAYGLCVGEDKCTTVNAAYTLRDEAESRARELERVVESGFENLSRAKSEVAKQRSRADAAEARVAELSTENLDLHARLETAIPPDELARAKVRAKELEARLEAVREAAHNNDGKVAVEDPCELFAEDIYDRGWNHAMGKIRKALDTPAKEGE